MEGEKLRKKYSKKESFCDNVYFDLLDAMEKREEISSRDKECPVCKLAEEVEKHFLQTFLKNFSCEDFQNRLHTNLDTTLFFITFSASLYFLTIFSKTGLIRRQGSHQSAEKSTITGTVDFSTILSQVTSFKIGSFT